MAWQNTTPKVHSIEQIMYETSEWPKLALAFSITHPKTNVQGPNTQTSRIHIQLT